MLVIALEGPQQHPRVLCGSSTGHSSSMALWEGPLDLAKQGKEQ